jgi:hypothetical protein
MVLQSADLGPAIRKTAESQGLRRRLPYDLGILLVHGIGEQQRGDTLTEAGDQLMEWLRRRAEAMGSAGGVDLNLMTVIARQASGDDIAGAHALIRITPPTEGGPPANWVVGESFWADVFRPATFSELAGWGVFIGPWAFAAQVRGIVQRMEIGAQVPRLLRFALLPIVWLVAAAMFLLAAFVGLAVTVLALALLVLVFTNIPLLATFARSAQRGLANGVGDAYVLTRSPIRFGAMSSQVRSDLRELCKESKAVAIIAHSQGTAVAWHAVKHELTDNPSEDSPVANHLRLFLTYGQAVRKLTFMRLIAQTSLTRHGPVASLGAGFALLAVALLLFGGPGPLMLITIALAIASEVALVSRTMPSWSRSGADLEADWDAVRQVAPKLEWLDLWASADPVPGGSLDLNGASIRSYKIRNLASGVLDHVVYWKNGTEFLAMVAARLFGLGGPRQYAAELTDPLLVASAMRRHSRVLTLMAMRVVLAGAAIAGALQAWWTPDFSAGLMDFLKRLQLPLVGDFFNMPPEWTRSLAGVIVVLVATVLVWSLFAAVWSSLTVSDEETYFQGITKRPLWDLRWYALGVIFLALPVGAGVLLSLLGNPVLAGFYAVATTFATLLALTVISSGGRTLTDAETPESPMAALRKVTGRPQSSAAVTGAIALILAAIPTIVAFAWNDALGWTLAIEGLLLSAVLAIEAAREYRLFARSFAAANDPPAIAV